jgi:hypothetical protein
MADRKMYNVKFAIFLFVLSFMTLFTVVLFYLSVFPIITGGIGLMEILLFLIFACSLASVGGIIYVLSRSFLIMYDRGDHYSLFGSFPRLTRKLVLNDHFQITKKVYVYDTGKEETILRHLVATDGLRTYRIVLLPKKWIYLIEKRKGHIRTWKVGLGEEMAYPPMI